MRRSMLNLEKYAEWGNYIETGMEGIGLWKEKIHPD